MIECTYNVYVKLENKVFDEFDEFDVGIPTIERNNNCYITIMYNKCIINV